MTMRLRRFNKDGIAAFESYLLNLSRTRSLPPPFSLLTERSFTETITNSEVEHIAFDSRFELAEHLNKKLAALENQIDVLHDVGLWSWLSLFYFNLICPENGKGQRKPGELVRYIPSVRDFRKYYRHLLAGPYLAYRAHIDDPERTLGLLSNPPDKPGEIFEQMAAVQGLLTAPGVVTVATKLYFDNNKQQLKPGSSGKKPGSARRLRDFLNQIDLTWDLYSIPPDRLLALLPEEFSKYK